MAHVSHISDKPLPFRREASENRVRLVVKQILNYLAELGRRSIDRGRFAALPLRLLEDIGMTIAERDAQLRYSDLTGVAPEDLLKRR
jgi:hypothetical protein